MTARRDKLGEFILVAEPRDRCVPFAGCCMIDARTGHEDDRNPDTLEMNIFSGTHDVGVPSAQPNEEQCLLLKLARPVTVTGDTHALVRQTVSFVTRFNVSLGACFAEYNWRIDWVTEDFEFTGDDCATAHTAPATSGDGVIDMLTVRAEGKPELLVFEGGAWPNSLLGKRVGQDGDVAGRGYSPFDRFTAYGIKVSGKRWSFSGGDPTDGIYWAANHILGPAGVGSVVPDGFVVDVRR